MIQYHCQESFSTRPSNALISYGRSAIGVSNEGLVPKINQKSMQKMCHHKIISFKFWFDEYYESSIIYRHHPRQKEYGNGEKNSDTFCGFPSVK